MPVDFLTDDVAAAYGRYAGVPSQADLERVFFLDDEDRALIDRHRGEHMKLGFALQLVTVRWVGSFLEDPLDVPTVVLDFVAEQLEVADPSAVKRYTGRAKTKLDHQWEIRRVHGLKEFTAAEAELREWVAARSWTSGDGPKAIFTDEVGWLRERRVPWLCTVPDRPLHRPPPVRGGQAMPALAGPASLTQHGSSCAAPAKRHASLRRASSTPTWSPNSTCLTTSNLFALIRATPASG
ncbi:DUF4158 domain-containing protein [Actinomadura geliboluensis]|nr:DUF4158 domain-containing protein [Actinomadura geliboluensis]